MSAASPAAAIGALAAKLGIGAPINLAVVGSVLLVVGFTAGHWLLASAPAHRRRGGPRFSFPRGPVLIIGLIGFCAVFGEAAAADWSAVYLKRRAGQPARPAARWPMPPSRSAWPAGGWSATLSWRVSGQCGTVRASGALGVLGGILVVTAVSPLVHVGFGLIGLGVAVVVPLAFSAAGHTGEHPTHAIAGIATVAYGAGLAAPGIIGTIAHATSYPIAFVVVTVLIVGSRRLVLRGCARRPLPWCDARQATPDLLSAAASRNLLRGRKVSGKTK